jgi:hypothetical protein
VQRDDFHQDMSRNIYVTLEIVMAFILRYLPNRGIVQRPSVRYLCDAGNSKGNLSRNICHSGGCTGPYVRIFCDEEDDVVGGGAVG